MSLPNVMVVILLVRKSYLEKQKEGKKKMKQIGSVEVPPDAFLAILSTKEN